MEAQIRIKGIDFVVEYDLQPYERATRDYPGCAESIDNISVYHKDTDFTEFFEDDMDMIEQEIRDQSYREE